MNTVTEYRTSDLALAAFLVMRGLPLLSAKRIQGRFEFIFDDKNFCKSYLSFNSLIKLLIGI